MSKKILAGLVVLSMGAGALLMAVIRPAAKDEVAPAKTIRVVEVVAGNENYRDVPLPDFGGPVALPNPAVFQKGSVAPRAEAKTVTLQPGEKTEIKALLNVAQVITFAWRAEGGPVYVDFHAHDPDAGGYWVRYEELESSSESSGSLVAPFAGEHGWFWMNIGEQPVTIKLDVSGYYDEIVDHGILNKAPAST